MADSENSSATGWIVGLLVAILLVLIWQVQNDEPPQVMPIPQPTEEVWQIDPQVKFECQNLQAKIDVADARASAATNYEEQSRWYNRARALETRYLSACNEYDTWLRTR